MRPRCDKDPNFYYDYVALLSTMCCTSKIGIEMMGLWPERIDPGLFQVLSDSLCVLDSKTGVIFLAATHSKILEVSWCGSPFVLRQNQHFFSQKQTKLLLDWLHEVCLCSTAWVPVSLDTHCVILDGINKNAWIETENWGEGIFKFNDLKQQAEIHVFFFNDIHKISRISI